MHVITETLRHQQLASSFLIDGHLNVQKLMGAAQVYIHAMAWTATSGITNALQVLEQHADHQPADDELAERIHPSFGWREVVEWAAYLALKNKLDDDLVADIRLIQTSMTLATITGRRVVGVFPIGADGKVPMASDFTIIVKRDGCPEMVWLDVTYDACPLDPDGLHHIGCGCEL